MPILETHNLVLRELTEKDLEGDYLQWMRDPEVNRFLESRFALPSKELLREFWNEQRNLKHPFFAICLKKDERHIGNIKLGPISSIHKRGEIGILLGAKSEWGKGFGSEAINALANYALEALGMKKVTAGVYSNNPASIRAFEKVGFVREGLLRKHFLSEDKWVDHVLLARFSEA